MPHTHDELSAVCRSLPTDYAPWGEVGNDKRGADCSWGCRWAQKLPGMLGADWLVCLNPASPRAGLLTFEHQAGASCFEPTGRRGSDLRRR